MKNPTKRRPGGDGDTTPSPVTLRELPCLPTAKTILALLDVVTAARHVVLTGGLEDSIDRLESAITAFELTRPV